MPSTRYCVFVVLDVEYGSRLQELLEGGPVWIVDTPINRAAAQSVWAESPQRDRLEGVTVFSATDLASPEYSLINELDMIDLHHGIHSADPPHTVIEIIGVPVTDGIKTELSHYGFNEFHPTAAGFRAVRPSPTISLIT